jgi:hypothetical protein
MSHLKTAIVSFESESFFRQQGFSPLSRTPFLMNGRGPKGQRHRFTHREDALIKEGVGQFGTSSWEEIASGLPGTTARQCRERWRHFLSGRREVDWTEDEDKIIVDKVQELGPKWTHIASLLCHRTDADVKARWHVVFKRIRQTSARNFNDSRRIARRERSHALHSDDEHSHNGQAAAGGGTDEKMTIASDGIAAVMDHLVSGDPAPFRKQSDGGGLFNIDSSWFSNE